MPNQIALDATFLQALAIGIVAFIAMVLIYTYRQRIAATNFPYLEQIIGKSVFWLIGIVIIVTCATAVLAVFGVTGTIRVLSAENLFYLALSYAAVSWAKSKS